MSPLCEVAQVNMNGVVLAGSPAEDWSMPDPSHPGAPAPKRRTPVF